MASMLDSLMQQLGGEPMKKMAGMIGSDEKTTENAAGAAISAILGGLARNSASPEGAASLSRALEKDHDGSVLDNFASRVGGQEAAAGEGILRHVLGPKQKRVAGGISQSTGLERGAAAKLMAMLAPAVMGALGKSQRQQGMNAGALAGLLGQEQQAIQKQNPQAAGLVGRLLDTDGDGDLDLSDLLKHGSGLLGKMFGGR